MYKGKLCWIVLFISIAHLLPAQHSNKANALLWRITGNGLTKPSYLFGTVHLRNKSLFNFSDSLYHSIESTDGFAMELDPEDISTAVADQLNNYKEDVLLKERIKRSDYERFKKKLRKEFGINADELTVKEFNKLKEQLVMPDNSREDMSTFMDAWLYQIAKSHGKTISGLEDLEDQLPEKDRAGEEFDPQDVKKLFGHVRQGRLYVKQMLNWYLDQDIQMLEKFSQVSSSEEDRKRFVRRNEKMAFRFDSLIRGDESYFAAIGAAHLAGSKGVIALMQQKGYTVEPVTSTVKVPAASYTFTKAELKWQEVSEPSMGYSIMMPGKPTSSEMVDGEMKIRMYYDMGNGVLYYTSFMRPTTAVSEANKDSVFTNMVNSNIEKGSEVISKKQINRFGMPGIEVYYKSKLEQMYIRMQVLSWGRKLYIIMTGSQKEELIGSYVDYFFNSFKMIEMPSSGWSKYTFEDDAFQINFPRKPETLALPVGAIDSTMKGNRYMALTDSEDLFFFVLVTRTLENYVIPNDSLYLDGVVKNMESQNYQFTSTPEKVTIDGYPAMRLNASMSTGLKVKAEAIIRGNRIYTLMVMYEKEEGRPAIDSFFRSFKMTQYRNPASNKVASDSNDFAVEIPAALVNTSDTSQHKVFSYYAYDSVTATTFTITRQKFSPYYWAASDSAFLKRQQQMFIEDTDTLVASAFFTKGPVKSADFTLQRKGTNRLHRIFISVTGMDVYFLEGQYTTQERNFAAERFFQSFTPLKNVETGIFANRPDKLFHDLTYGDSLTYANAYNALSEVEFEKSDAALLLRQSVLNYREDTSNYRSVNTILLDKLAALSDHSMVPMIKETYTRLSRAQEKYKYPLLTVLAKLKTMESYQTIRQLVQNAMPAEGHAGAFVASLHDSLLLSRQLMPSLLVHIQDSIWSLPLSYLQLTLADSSMMTKEEIMRNEKAWIAAARKYAIEVSKGNHLYNGTYDSDLVGLLLLYNTAESNAAAAEFLKSSDIYLKRLTAVGLLKNGRSVDTKVSDAIAADKYNRVFFYQNLLKLGKTNLFPAKYLSQKSFAESYAYEAFDDEEPNQLTFIGERIALFKGEKRKFFLYKAVFSYDDESYSYLAVSGPFSLNAAEVLPDDSYSGYCEEPFQQSKVSKQFADYLSQFEETEDEEE